MLSERLSGLVETQYEAVALRASLASVIRSLEVSPLPGSDKIIRRAQQLRKNLGAIIARIDGEVARLDPIIDLNAECLVANADPAKPEEEVFDLTRQFFLD